jgi:hypothetical protein
MLEDRLPSMESIGASRPFGQTFQAFQAFQAALNLGIKFDGKHLGKTDTLYMHGEPKNPHGMSVTFSLANLRGPVRGI